MTLTPYDYQEQSVQSIIDYLESGETGNPLVVAPTGCHAKGTQILMFDGSTKNVEDVKVGDMLMGPDSKPRKVLELHTGKEEMYKITPKRGGESFVVNKGHILHLKRSKEKSTCTKEYPNVNISVSEYLQQNKTFKHLHKLIKTGVEFTPKEVPLDPWIVGIMLGDGILVKNPGIRGFFNSSVCKISIYAQSLGCDVRAERTESTNSTAYFFNKGTNKDNEFTKILKEAGIWNQRCEDRFVPIDYKVNSKEIRARVLAGLLDADASLSDGTFDFFSKSKQLALDVQFLARSLGLTARVSSSFREYQNPEGVQYWRVFVSGDFSSLPFVRHDPQPRKTKKNNLVSGFDIEPVGVDTFYGFSIDSDSLYLTADFTIHHNSGKSLIIAEFCKRFVMQSPAKKVLIIAHRKELLTQNTEEILGQWELAPVGVYSAGLKRRQLDKPITVAGIESIYRRAKEIGSVDIIIIDECHLLSPKRSGIYKKLITTLKSNNPNLKVVGLTATPYRLDQGFLHEGDDRIFTDICFNIDLNMLIEKGYLAPLVGKIGVNSADLSDVKVRGKEYVEEDLQKAFTQGDLVERAVDEIIKYAKERKSWLLFSAGVEHGEQIITCLRKRGINSDLILGDTPSLDRDRAIKDFKDGKVRALTSCGVLSTGFNARNVDLIAVLRATRSVALYVQIGGRGMRISPETGKRDCLFLDFGGNIERHGPIDQIKIVSKDSHSGGMYLETAPQKACIECREPVPLSYAKCPACGLLFELPFKHDDKASTANPISDGAPLIMEVSKVVYRKKEGTKPSLEVIYSDNDKEVSQLWCFEHGGFLKKKALLYWWESTKEEFWDNPLPNSVDEALKRVNELAEPIRIFVKNENGFDRITKKTF